MDDVSSNSALLEVTQAFSGTTKPNKPHDKAFKRAMERPEVAKDFILQHYPKNLTAKMDFTTLRLCPNSYIDETYVEKESDVLFEIKLSGEQAYLYILVEHFSTPDRLASFRLLEYIVRIMSQSLRKHGGQQVPLVLPLLFYTGNKQWNHSTDFRDLIVGPREAVEHVWSKPYPFFSAKEMRDNDITRHQWSGTLAWIMSHVKARDMLAQLKKSSVMRILEEFDRQGGRGRAFMIELMRYLIYTSKVDKIQLRQFIQQHFTPEVEEKVMTLAERLHNEGMQKGMQKGALLI